MPGPVQKNLDRRMGRSVPVELQIEGREHWGEAVWLEPGRAHVLLHARLRCDVECCLSLTPGGQRVALFAKVLVVASLPEIDVGPSIMHLCAIDIPAEALSDFDTLLRRVNPGCAPLELPARAEAPRATPRRWSTAPLEEPSGRQRLRPARRRSPSIPKVVQGSGRSPIVRERRTRTRAEGQKGLRTEELVRVQAEGRRGAELVARFDSAELWRRSARLGSDWMQLVLADSIDIAVGSTLCLTVVLPSRRTCFLQVRLARRSRGRMISGGEWSLGGLPQGAVGRSTPERRLSLSATPPVEALPGPVG